MRLSVEILDHIFSFLVDEHVTLLSCSDDPVLSPLVERYLYHTIGVFINEKTFAPTDIRFFSPDRLFECLSENPRLRNHVRILHVVDFLKLPSDEAIRTLAQILVLFPTLQSIRISIRGRRWLDVFRASLKGPLNLSTVKDLGFVGEETKFPFWFLDKCENLTDLSLSGTFDSEEDDTVSCDSTPAQLNSLRLGTSLQSSSLNWVKLRINQLESLTISSHMDPTTFQVLLGTCSETLKKLDITLAGSDYQTLHSFQTQQHLGAIFPVFSPLPVNLQQLTIRITIEFFFISDDSPDPQCCLSCLPAAAELIRQFIPRCPRHLVLDITFRNVTDLTNIDFSPLAVLAAASVSIPRIDLFAMAPTFLPRSSIPITDSRLMSALENNTDVVKLINEGKIAIHSQKNAS